MAFNYAKRREYAVNVAKEILVLSQNFEPPVNLEQMIKHFGIRMVDDDLKGADGYTLYIPEKDKYLICYDSRRFGYFRTRFTIAHELGHIFLNHFTNEKLFNSTESRLDFDANEFAGALLMPEDYLMEYENCSAAEIMRVFQVSQQAFDTRMKVLNEVTRRHGIFTGLCPCCNRFLYKKKTLSCGECGVAL